MIVILRPDHTIVYFSPFAEQLTGYPAGEVLGRDFLDAASCPKPTARPSPRNSPRVLAGQPTRGLREPDRLPRRLAPLDASGTRGYLRRLRGAARRSWSSARTSPT